jgi:hypothetical protein
MYLFHMTLHFDFVLVLHQFVDIMWKYPQNHFHQVYVQSSSHTSSVTFLTQLFNHFHIHPLDHIAYDMKYFLSLLLPALLAVVASGEEAADDRRLDVTWTG